MNKCSFCNRIINNKGSLVAHISCCKNNPNRIKHKRSKLAGRKKGSVPWNKNQSFEKKTKEKLIETIETGKYKTHSDNNIRKLIKTYLIYRHGHKCMICGIHEWMNVKIPLVCDHIDGNSKNNELNNFRIICNNCDSILPTFKGKNKGRGRKNRYNCPS
jgi:5-methylcytosine-specific restriction endonuclease McrA